MKSHITQWEPRDLLRLVGGPLLAMGLFAALMHLGAAWGMLPRPRPALDVDRTILLHQIEASRARQDAEILLLGDSSCLMDVDARQLSGKLGRSVLNLGTLSYLDLNAGARLLREYTAANPGRLRAVVLLMHPEALRRPAPEPYHVALFQRLLEGRDAPPPPGWHGRLTHVLGLEHFRARVWSGLVPAPLPGPYGRAYGFSADLDAAMTRHRGSAVDPETQPLSGDAEYRLAASLEPASRTFRAAVPPGVRLWIGITPVPAGFALPDYPETRARMLRGWGQWLQADAVLDGLPPMLPAERFARTTHLAAAGAREYTDVLAALLPLNRIDTP